MKAYESILDELKVFEGEELPLQEKKYEKFLSKCWEIIRKGDAKSIEFLCSNLGESKYKKIEEYVKEKNKEYYAFDYFRKTGVEIEVRKALLKTIYENTIIVSDYGFLLEIIKEKKFPRSHLEDIMTTLRRITEFCVSYNRKGKQLVEILIKAYDLDSNVCGSLETMYDDNRISLKMDYLISIVEYLLPKEE